MKIEREDICYEKEEHLGANWHEHEMAKIWHKVGILIQKLVDNKIIPLERDIL